MTAEKVEDDPRYQAKIEKMLEATRDRIAARARHVFETMRGNVRNQPATNQEYDPLRW